MSTEILKYDDDDDDDDNISHFVVNRDGKGVSFTCPVCGRTFTSAKEYANHKHYKNNPHDEKFPTIRREINEEISAFGPYAKDIDVALSTLVSKGTHNSGGKVFYSCVLGDNKVFKDRTLLEYHILKMHGDELSNIISKLDTEKSNWRFGRHLTEGQINNLVEELANNNIVGEYKGRYEYKCPLHKAVFYDLNKYKNHILNSHTEGELLAMLGKLTPDDVEGAEEQVAENVRFKDKEGKIFFRCPVDGYRFKTKEEFIEHFKTHTPEQRFQNVLWRKSDIKRNP
jgi:uncharacterized C2H2 Zn-finger protein